MLRLEEANTHNNFFLIFFFLNLLRLQITMKGPSLNTQDSTTTIKFLCSYGGRILPRYPDGKLRYHGGQTRVLAVDRSVSFSELLVKLAELCGSSVCLRCQLPTEDLDALVSITSDEDLVNVIEEYDRESILRSKSLKIRAFLSLPKKPSLSPSTGSSPSSSASTATHDAGSPKSPLSSAVYSAAYSAPRLPITATNRCIYASKSPVQLPVRYTKSAGKLPCYAYGNPSRSYLVHHGNHWQ